MTPDLDLTRLEIVTRLDRIGIGCGECEPDYPNEVGTDACSECILILHRCADALLEPIDWDDLEVSSTDEPEPAQVGYCNCWACDPGNHFMILCPSCGNKRCPKANHHNNACTRSNEPGQPGSAYEHSSGAASARRLAAWWDDP